MAAGSCAGVPALAASMSLTYGSGPLPSLYRTFNGGCFSGSLCQPQRIAPIELRSIMKGKRINHARMATDRACNCRPIAVVRPMGAADRGRFRAARLPDGELLKLLIDHHQCLGVEAVDRTVASYDAPSVSYSPGPQ